MEVENGNNGKVEKPEDGKTEQGTGNWRDKPAGGTGNEKRWVHRLLLSTEEGEYLGSERNVEASNILRRYVEADVFTKRTESFGFHTEELRRLQEVPGDVREILNYFRGGSKDIGISKQEQSEILQRVANGGINLPHFLNKYKHKQLRSGFESDVYLIEYKDGKKKVLKETDWKSIGTIGKGGNNLFNFIINKFALQNTIFPETSYRFIGFTVKENTNKSPDIKFLLEQKYIEPLKKDGKEDETVDATLEELDFLMQQKGFEREGELYISPNYIISDLAIKKDGRFLVKDGNTIKGSDSKLYCIDPVILLNTKDSKFGGDRSYEEFLQ